MNSPTDVDHRVARVFALPPPVLGTKTVTECPVCWMSLCFHDQRMLRDCRRRLKFDDDDRSD